MKLTVITDESGKLLGALREEEIKDGDRTIRFFGLPQPGQKHYNNLDVADNFLQQPAHELEKALFALVPRK